MRQLYEIALLVFAVALVLLSIDLVAVFTGLAALPAFLMELLFRLPDNSGGWFYEYQTLVAGILAIFAAMIGGSYVLRAATYPSNLDALSEARRYRQNLGGTSNLLLFEIIALKKNEFNQQSFFKQWDRVLFNVREMEAKTIETLELTGHFLQFRVFLDAANSVVEGLKNGSLSMPQDQELIIEHLENFHKEMHNYAAEISKKCKGYKRSKI